MQALYLTSFYISLLLTRCSKTNDLTALIIFLLNIISRVIYIFFYVKVETKTNISLHQAEEICHKVQYFVDSVKVALASNIVLPGRNACVVREVKR